MIIGVDTVHNKHGIALRRVAICLCLQQQQQQQDASWRRGGGTQEKEAVVSDSDHLFDSIRSLLFFRRASLSLSLSLILTLIWVFFFFVLFVSLFQVFVKSRSLSLSPSHSVGHFVFSCLFLFKEKVSRVTGLFPNVRCLTGAFGPIYPRRPCNNHTLYLSIAWDISLDIDGQGSSSSSNNNPNYM